MVDTPSQRYTPIIKLSPLLTETSISTPSVPKRTLPVLPSTPPCPRNTGAANICPHLSKIYWVLHNIPLDANMSISFFYQKFSLRKLHPSRLHGYTHIFTATLTVSRVRNASPHGFLLTPIPLSSHNTTKPCTSAPPRETQYPLPCTSPRE